MAFAVSFVELVAFTGWRFVVTIQELEVPKVLYGVLLVNYFLSYIVYFILFVEIFD
jgi:hypothetical protein